MRACLVIWIYQFYYNMNNHLAVSCLNRQGSVPWHWSMKKTRHDYRERQETNLWQEKTLLYPDLLTSAGLGVSSTVSVSCPNRQGSVPWHWSMKKTRHDYRERQETNLWQEKTLLYPDLLTSAGLGVSSTVSVSCLNRQGSVPWHWSMKKTRHDYRERQETNLWQEKNTTLSRSLDFCRTEYLLHGNAFPML